MCAKRAKATRKGVRPAKQAGERRAHRRQLLLFTRKFLLAAALIVIPLSLTPEDFLGPLNRFTAAMAANLLRLLPVTTVVRGTHITFGGFSVNVIGECSAVHLVALLGAFIFAFPANRSEKWIGFAAGTVLLTTANIIRIAMVTMIGWRFPSMFEPAHVYLGQLAMLGLMLVNCLLWCRWLSQPDRMDGPMGFWVRFLMFSSLPFLLWLPLNRVYMGAIDGCIQWLFSFTPHHLVMPRAHQTYYQTFSLVALAGLLMAVKGAPLARRLRWMAGGFAVLTLFQVAFRLCNVWISAFHIQWVVPVSMLIYALCVYALPLAMAAVFVMQTRLQQPVSGLRDAADKR